MIGRPGEGAGLPLDSPSISPMSGELHQRLDVIRIAVFADGSRMPVMYECRSRHLVAGAAGRIPAQLSYRTPNRRSNRDHPAAGVEHDDDREVVVLGAVVEPQTQGR